MFKSVTAVWTCLLPPRW